MNSSVHTRTGQAFTGEVSPDGGIPEKSVERLALYRRILKLALEDGKRNIFSHEIAALSGSTSAQVRRDLMQVGFLGNPRHGYEIEGLLRRISSFFGTEEGVKMVLVGVGNLGRAILSYFSGKKPHLSVEAAFDNDSYKSNRTIHGCHCYPLNDLEKVVKGHHIHVGVIAVPASEAQKVTDQLVASGVSGILNFAPARLRVPQEVFVHDLDMTLMIEKVSFFSKASARGRKEV